MHHDGPAFTLIGLVDVVHEKLRLDRVGESGSDPNRFVVRGRRSDVTREVVEDERPKG